MTVFDKCQVYNDTLTVKKRDGLLGIEVVYKIFKEVKVWAKPWMTILFISGCQNWGSED